MQEEVEKALGAILGAPDDPPRLTVAGRTDTGVHALGQVCSYVGEAVDPQALNAVLPPDVAVLSCEPAPEGFDARRDATSRAYCYRVLARRERSAFWAGRAVWWPHRVDLDALHACAAELTGVHDFTSFTPTETKHVRFERQVYAARWARAELGAGGAEAAAAPGAVADAAPGAASSGVSSAVLEFCIEADAFMRHMNRVLLGTMLEVAGGRRSVPEFAQLLRGGPRSAAGPTAPACGLYLVGVGYEGERVLQD